MEAPSFGRVETDDRAHGQKLCARRKLGNTETRSAPENRGSVRQLLRGPGARIDRELQTPAWVEKSPDANAAAQAGRVQRKVISAGEHERVVLDTVELLDVGESRPGDVHSRLRGHGLNAAEKDDAREKKKDEGSKASCPKGYHVAEHHGSLSHRHTSPSSGSMTVPTDWNPHLVKTRVEALASAIVWARTMRTWPLPNA